MQAGLCIYSPVRAFDGFMKRPMTDDVAQRIERYQFPRGAVTAQRRNRGYTLSHVLSGALVARLRPTGDNGRFEVLTGQLG